MVMKINIFDASLYLMWLEEKKNLAASSIFLYKGCIMRFAKRNPDVESIEDYNNFLIEMTMKKRCNHYFSVLKSFIQYKITDGALREKLIEGLIKPKERHDSIRIRRHLSEEQILNVLNGFTNQKHAVIALVQTLTGIRAGDILRLKEGNILPEQYEGKNVLRLNILGKGKKRNVIYIHDTVAQEIVMNYITHNVSTNGFYFLEYGKMGGVRRGNIENENAFILMNYAWYWRDLKIACQSAGINSDQFSTHDFRRCFARRAWERYKDVHILQSLLNHTDPKNTLRYLEQSGLKNIDYHKELQSQ